MAALGESRARDLTVRVGVAIPAFDEADQVVGCLDSIAGQVHLPDVVVVVDNASTDGTGDLARRWAEAQPGLDVVVVHEPRKGTGAAADTGMRLLIEHGCEVLARTDADCRPDPGWLAAAVTAIAAGNDLVVGRIVARRDEGPTWRERIVLPAAVTVAGWFGRVRPSNRGRRFRTRYRMCAGNNMALTTSLYLRSGGFPRTSIDVAHEDRALMNACRELTDRIVASPDMVVGNSLRRVRAWGLARTLAWYADHHWRPPLPGQVDVR